MEFNKAAYLQSLERAVDLSNDTFQYHMERLLTFHVGLIRTYLWISAFLITVFLTVMKDSTPVFWEKWVVSLAILSAFAAFILAVDQLRGRESFVSYTDRPKSLADIAHKTASGEEWQHEAFLMSLIEGYHLSLPDLEAASMKRVKILRRIAFLLTFSGIAGIVAALSMVF